MGTGETSNDTPSALRTGSPERLLDIVHAIYLATLQPDSWARIMQTLMPVVGTGKQIFLQINRDFPEESIAETQGLTPEYRFALRSRPLDQDILWRAVLPLDAGTLFRSAEICPPELLRSCPLWELIASPGGSEYVAGLVLENSPQYFSSFAFTQSADDFSAATIDSMRLLLPHLQSALQIGRQIALAEAGRREAGRSIENARQAVIVLDDSGYMLYRNAAARQVLEQADGMSLRYGRFVFADIEVQAEFERQLRMALAPRSPNAAPVSLHIRVPRSAGAPYGLAVSPIQRSLDRAMLPEGARCTVFIHDLAGANPLSVQRLSWLYNLSPQEARVCEALYRLGTVDAVAQEMSVTQHTVRSHLKAIYTKLGVTNQMQLVKRLASAVLPATGALDPIWE